jgi:hypothetical protein
VTTDRAPWLGIVRRSASPRSRRTNGFARPSLPLRRRPRPRKAPKPRPDPNALSPPADLAGARLDAVRLHHPLCRIEPECRSAHREPARSGSKPARLRLGASRSSGPAGARRLLPLPAGPPAEGRVRPVSLRSVFRRGLMMSRAARATCRHFRRR